MGSLNGSCAGFDIHRYEDDRIELLRDHRVELFLLNNAS